MQISSLPGRVHKGEGRGMVYLGFKVKRFKKERDLASSFGMRISEVKYQP
jgi:hypothetical protein